MGFWSGTTLRRRLLDEKLVVPYEKSQIDCASYRLSLGSQAFVTKDRPFDGTGVEPKIQSLNDENAVIVINPGQFAFLLTEETVTVPADAIALISMRAGMKFRGLINVSGFHVDPGFSGKLIFGVYNAGPSEIYMCRGDAIFLIVYASLDEPSEKDDQYDGGSNGQNKISAELIQKMTGQVFSPMLLQRQMNDLNLSHRELDKELASMKGRDFFHVSLAGIALAFIGAAIATVVALTTSDWGKAAAGMWIQGAINAYAESAKPPKPEERGSAGIQGGQPGSQSKTASVTPPASGSSSVSVPSSALASSDASTLSRMSESSSVSTGVHLTKSTVSSTSSQ